MRGSFLPFSLFRTKDLPETARPHYALEWRHLVGWGILAGVVEGNTSNIVAIKTFGASKLLADVVYVTPMLANVLALSLSAWSRGRPRMQMFSFYAAIACVLVASVAVTPASAGAWAGWVFAGQIALVRIFVAGLVTLRTTLWQLHYPESHRARIAGRLQTLRFLMGLLAAASAAMLFDAHATYYRFVYPSVALVGALSLIPLRRGREVRFEQEQAAAERAADTLVPRPGLVGSVREGLQILRSDRMFARYCTAQYLLGSAAFFIDPLIVWFVSTRLAFGYFASNLTLDVIPRLVTLLSIAPFALYFERVGILRFRVANSGIWLAGFTLTTAAVGLCSLPAADALLRSETWRSFAVSDPANMGVFSSSLAHLAELAGFAPLAIGIALLLISRVIVGLGQGGGSIAWNIGHLHFARDHKAEMYMNIHVALTGVRGLLMPFLATACYRLLDWYCFFIGVALAIAALLAFVRLARDDAAAAELTEPAPAPL